MKKTVLSFLLLILSVVSSVGQTWFSAQEIIDNSSGLSYPYGVYAADLDGDGYKDILVANGGAKELVWYKNNGNGTFSSKNVVETLSTYPFEVIAVDMDGDNDKDIVCSSFVYQGSGEIRWYKNDGNGNFSSSQLIRSVTDPDTNNFNYINIHTGDIDKDGDYDIATTCSYDSTLIWYENDGTGNLSEHLIANHIKLSDYQADLDLYIADINNDDQMEIVYSADSLEYYSYSDGFVQKTAIYIENTANYPDMKIAVADINQDGYNEFYLGHNSLICLINNQNGTFNPSFVDNSSTINNVFAADLNKNGYPDLLAAYDKNGSSGYLDKVIWFVNDGSGTFTANTLIDFSNDGGQVWGIYAADLDNDGDLDVIASSPASSQVVWVENYTLEILKQPQDTSSCDGQTAVLYVQAKDADSYRWQLSTDGGSTFNDITDDATYYGTANDTLKIKYTSSLAGYIYRCVVSNANATLISGTATLSNDGNAPEISDNITGVYLDESGTANVYAKYFGIIDAVELADSTLSQSAFNCSETGDHALTISLKDVCGNTASYSVTATVSDTLKPEITSANVTLYLDADGSATLYASDLGLWDNCSITDSTLSRSSFSCSDLGSNTVSLIATDASNNSLVVDVNVTVADTIRPELDVQNITVALDDNGSARITAKDVVTSASDNCSVADTTLDVFAFDCSNLGDNTVTVTLTDGSGNSVQKTITVTVKDDIAPKLDVQNITVALDDSGSARITAKDVVTSASDNCSVADTTLDISVFNCSNLGDNTVTVTLTDGSGNSVQKTVTVTVEDNIAPVISCIDNVTVKVDADGVYTVNGTEFDATASDNCSFTLTNDLNDDTTLDGEKLTAGTYTITWTASDETGNSVECQFTIKVTDTSTRVNNLKTQEVKAYPNPVHNTLYVETGTRTGNLLLIDFTGRIISNAKINGELQKVDVSGLDPGVYLLKIESEYTGRVVKIVKQ